MSAVYTITAYPKQLTLRDGSAVTIRALQPDDERPLLDFFLGISDEERFFLKDDVTKADAAKLISEIQEIDGVRAVEFITKSDAMKKFTDKFGKKYLSGISENPFPPSLIIRLEPGIMLAKVADFIAQKYGRHAYVTQIAVPGDVAQKVSEALRIFIIMSIIWAAILIFGALLVILNTIKIAIYGRRDSIEIMQLVGATPSFIHRPFAVEGFVQGIFAGALAALSLYAVSKGVKYFLPPIITPSKIILYGLILSGAIFGVFGSRLAVKRFL